MDPMVVLLSALSAASTAVGPISDDVVRDAYKSLKALIVRKFGAGNPKIEPTLADYADDAETYRKAATKVFKDAGVDRDQEVMEFAARVLRTAEAAQPGISGGVVGQLNAQGG